MLQQVSLAVSAFCLAILVCIGLGGLMYALRETLAAPERMFQTMVREVFTQCDVDHSGTIDEKVCGSF